ncbi:MAG: hypothetical protein S4CHLAM37_01820 [Chlamydiia bacterium]|nr:hypothetical protein [Chlamydiia bacterium]
MATAFPGLGRRAEFDASCARIFEAQDEYRTNLEALKRAISEDPGNLDNLLAYLEKSTKTDNLAKAGARMAHAHEASQPEASQPVEAMEPLIQEAIATGVVTIAEVCELLLRVSEEQVNTSAVELEKYITAFISARAAPVAISLLDRLYECDADDMASISELRSQLAEVTPYVGVEEYTEAGREYCALQLESYFKDKAAPASFYMDIERMARIHSSTRIELSSGKLEEGSEEHAQQYGANVLSAHYISQLLPHVTLGEDRQELRDYCTWVVAQPSEDHAPYVEVFEEPSSLSELPAERPWDREVTMLCSELAASQMGMLEVAAITARVISSLKKLQENPFDRAASREMEEIEALEVPKVQTLKETLRTHKDFLAALDDESKEDVSALIAMIKVLSTIHSTERVVLKTMLGSQVEAAKSTIDMVLQLFEVAGSPAHLQERIATIFDRLVREHLDEVAALGLRVSDAEYDERAIDELMGVEDGSVDGLAEQLQGMSAAAMHDPSVDDLVAQLQGMSAALRERLGAGSDRAGF